jgi:formyltetrahydrofolate synthetase
MLTELDQNTLANMTAALDSVCKKIPADKDSHDLRKRIGDAIVAYAHSGRRTYFDFEAAGQRVLKDALKPRKRGWLSWMC